MKDIKCSMCSGDSTTEYVLCYECAEEARNEYYDGLDEDLAFERELRDGLYDRPDCWKNDEGEWRVG